MLLLVCFAADIIYTGGILLMMVIDRQFDYAGRDLGIRLEADPAVARC